MYTEILVFVLLLFLFYFLSFLRKKGKGKLPPGPISLPIVGYLPFMGKVPCETVAKLSKKYGSMLTLQMGNHPVVFINDYHIVKDIYKLDVLTGRAQLDLFKPRGYYGLGLLEGKDWKEVRRFLMRCLRDLGFGKKSMESSILDEVVRCLKFLKENEGKPLYLKPLLEISVVNALWLMLTGEKYDMEDEKKRKVLHMLSEGLANQNIIGISTFLPNIAKIFPNLSGYNKGMKYFGAPEELAREIIQKHIQTYSVENQQDFIYVGLSKIFGTKDPRSMFYKERGLKNLHYTLIDLFFAGSDTMSSTLGWTFLYLSIWKNCQQKVHDEIDSVIGRARIPSLEDRSKMPYVEAVMAETLRKSSMVPFGLFHTPIENFEYGDYKFPKGTYFLTNLHHIHQDPAYWKDPENFRPERFITPEGKFRKDDHLIPFFTGKRSCPGENLAMIEYFLFLVGILQTFELELDPSEPTPDVRPFPGFILMPPKHNLFIRERTSVRLN